MGNPQPATSPWVWETADSQGEVLRVTITFSQTTRAITGITVFRDPGCDFTQLLVGLGTGNNPNATDKAIDIPDGTTVLTAQRLNQLANRGMDTIEDVQAFQITAA